MIVKSFIKTGQIIDSKEVGNRLKVYMKFNAESRDREGDLFLKSAWTNREDSETFAKKGYYDYNHLSVMKPSSNLTPSEIAQSELMRLKAVIGKPDPDPSKAIYWSDVEQGSITEGYLDGDNDFVKQIKSLTKSGYVFEASAAGGIFEPSERTIQEHGEKTWDRAIIKHIAICPVQEAINPDTYVLLKSMLGKEMGINETLGEIKKMENTSTIVKPSAIHEFVLSSPEFANHIVNGIISEIQKGSLDLRYEPIKRYLLDREIPESEAQDCAELVISKFKKF